MTGFQDRFGFVLERAIYAMELLRLPDDAVDRLPEVAGQLLR